MIHAPAYVMRVVSIRADWLPTDSTPRRVIEVVPCTSLTTARTLERTLRAAGELPAVTTSYPRESRWTEYRLV